MQKQSEKASASLAKASKLHPRKLTCRAGRGRGEGWSPVVVSVCESIQPAAKPAHKNDPSANYAAYEQDRVAKREAQTAKPAHTPGPWRIAPDLVTIHCGDKDDPEIVATTYVNDLMAIQSEKQQEANARLIAAAPELLAACKAAEQHMRRERGIEYVTADHPIKQLRAAIASVERSKQSGGGQ
jgi:hypothetical protein